MKLINKKAQIIKKLEFNNEFRKEVILAPCLIKWKKFELVIQKAAELGVSKVIPVISDNVSMKLPSDFQKRVIRWNEIAKNACQQAHRNKKMIVENPTTLREILNFKIKNKFVAYEKKEATTPLNLPQDSLFLIGPEGGFSKEEIKLSNEKNFQVISLGKRILRAETASFFVLSRVN